MEIVASKKSPYFLLCFLLIPFLAIKGQNGVFEFQNATTIEQYLEDNKLDYDRDDLFVFKEFQDFFDHNEDKQLRGPIVHVFNSEGLYLEWIKIKDINKKLSDFSKIKKKPRKDAIKIDRWLDRMVNFETFRPITGKEKVDFYFVLNWAVFFNKPENNKALFKWYELLRQQKLKGKNIQIFLLNMDFQDSWQLSPEKREDILYQANNQPKK